MTSFRVLKEAPIAFDSSLDNLARVKQEEIIPQRRRGAEIRIINTSLLLARPLLDIRCGP